ncbi:MAG: carbohydrate ABC transporter permease [Candidatus Rifleibacteriota bacterium]
MTRENLIKNFLIFATSMFLLAFTLGPFIWMIWISLADKADFLITGEVSYSFNNYYQVLTSESLHFLDYLKNSLLISVITAALVTLFSSMAAYAVSRMRFPGRSLIPLAILAMSMFPQISIVGYLFEMFSKFGLINTHMALILPYIAWTIPIALWINMSYFTQIPLDLDKAALVDGAGRMKVLFKIIFPLALPGIFSSALLVFIACFNEFLFAIMLTIDYTAQTLPVGIALFQGLHGEIPWGNLMAASAIASVPLVIMTLIFQRYIVQGLMGGAVKG